MTGTERGVGERSSKAQQTDFFLAWLIEDTRLTLRACARLEELLLEERKELLLESGGDTAPLCGLAQPLG